MWIDYVELYTPPAPIEDRLNESYYKMLIQYYLPVR